MINKIKIFFKLHYKSIIIFIGILLIVSPVILSRYLNDLDEIWNYNFARNVADDLIPYKDFNMVPTPLLPLICGFLLRIFGNELFVMRLIAILLISLIFFMIYKILKILKVNNIFNIFFIFILFLIFKDYICIDYNFSILLLLLLLIYLELKKYFLYSKNKILIQNENFSEENNINKKNKIKKDKFKKILNINLNTFYINNLFYYFFVGLICGLCILLKQSSGLIITAVSILYPILFIKNNKKNIINKENIIKEKNNYFEISFVDYLKITFIKCIGIILPIIFLIIYLICNNAFNDFIDYTILGIKTFSNSISYTTLINSQNLLIKLLSIFMPISIFVISIYLSLKKDKKIYGFYFYSISSLVVIYPIADNIHFLIGITPLLILSIYLLNKLFNYLFNKIELKIKNILFKKIKLYIYELIKAIIILFLIYFLITSCNSLYNYSINKDKEHNIMHYKNIPISENLLNKINEVDNYILSQKNEVYILDSEAAIYMISINKYNKDFDMFNKGNLGSNGEVGQIEKIKSFEKGTKILIKNKNYNLNWQTPLEVIFYIRNNLNKIGQVSIFDIYEI